MEGPVHWLWVSPVYTGSQLLKGGSGQRGTHHLRPLRASLDPSLSGSLGEAGPILDSEKDWGSGLPGSLRPADSGLLLQGGSGCSRGPLSRSRGCGRRTRAGTSAACSSWTGTAPRTTLPTAPGCTSQSPVRGGQGGGAGRGAGSVVPVPPLPSRRAQTLHVWRPGRLLLTVGIRPLSDLGAADLVGSVLGRALPLCPSSCLPGRDSVPGGGCGALRDTPRVHSVLFSPGTFYSCTSRVISARRKVIMLPTS